MNPPDRTDTALPAVAPKLRVAYRPLDDAVALLDTSSPDWVIYLDSESPSEDHIWALLEALEIVTEAIDTAPTAATARHLRVVPDPSAPTPR